MKVLRIKPNILSGDLEQSRRFYLDVLGLEEGGGLDWILFFGGDTAEVQLSVMHLDIHAHVHPDVSVEVDDVQRFHQRAVEAGAEIVYPLTHEPSLTRGPALQDRAGASASPDAIGPCRRRGTSFARAGPLRRCNAIALRRYGVLTGNDR